MKPKLSLAWVVTSTALVLSPAVAQTNPNPAGGPGRSIDPVIESGVDKNPGLGEAQPRGEKPVGESYSTSGVGESHPRNSIAPGVTKDCTKDPTGCAEPPTTGALPPPPLPQQSK